MGDEAAGFGQPVFGVAAVGPGFGFEAVEEDLEQQGFHGVQFAVANAFDFFGAVGPVQVGFVDRFAGGAAAQQGGLVFAPEQQVGVVVGHPRASRDGRGESTGWGWLSSELRVCRFAAADVLDKKAWILRCTQDDGEGGVVTWGCCCGSPPPAPPVEDGGRDV